MNSPIKLPPPSFYQNHEDVCGDEVGPPTPFWNQTAVEQAVRDALASAPVAGEAVCKTCGGSRVDPGGLPICRDCGPVAGEAQCAERDMLEEARAEIEMIREALGVSYEPHQSLFDRMLEACDGIRHAAKARGMLEWIGPNGTAAGPALVADVPGGWVRCNADGANIGGNFLTLLQEIAEDSTQADKDGGQLRSENWPEEPTTAMIEALRTGSRKDWPSDELCRVRYAALRSAVQASAPPKENNHAEGADQ